MRRAIVAAAAALAILLAGCSSDQPQVLDEPPTPADTAEVGDEGTPPSEEESSGGDAQGPARFNQVYKYENGVQVAITKVSKRPGIVAFTIKITNGSDQIIDGGGTYVTASYGKDGTPADESYDYDNYIQGKVLPKRAKSAVWGFEIPDKQRGDVVLEVTPSWGDIDYGPAIFQGAIR
jgi:hypothetical protein